ncbi:bifunctional RNase H/acid phosphatase [Micromonospora peucetia]|uniref:Probable phosphoglycerate mutase n=1 Tax=Micromonospora peucetia TaxID=47871 RepID=A0A1C6VMZ3_9ACTN|nr:bifunctional RNase H/acid phosphatase [Micromonospora peucetia]MCX4388700.1 bifunctional RNase H/acid phosphatase [Micromonospora peucetia]SCL67635.1 probable phosphoglycerate mutase [Micromonospora peucetia]
MAPRVVVVEADGGSRGNPGPAGYGAVVRDQDTGEVLAERSESIGVATNNVAEYRGLIAGLEAAAELGAAEVDARMDSKLVVEQMSGRWQIKHPGLRPLAAQAAVLVSRFAAVRFHWIPRERNRHADALANAAMDAAAGRAPAARAAVVPPRVVEPPREVAGPDSSARARAREVAARAASTATSGTDPATAPASWEPRPSFTATRLILVRHGETAYTEQRRYSGRGDVPLSERGRAQVRATAARVAALAPSVAAVVSSPLSRCTATAEAIAGVLGGVPVRREDDLIECDFGAWEGRTFAEVREEWPGEMDAWLASTRVAPPDGESFVDVAERCRRAVDGLCRAYPGETVVVVSHVSPIKLVLRDALAAGDGFLHRLFLDAAGISVLDTWPDGGVAVRTVNDTAHLDAVG